MLNSYKDLIVWQKSMDLVEIIYDFTSNFPANEEYGLKSQMRRASVSIPSNIAEGHGRGTRKDYKHFLDQAYGSACELETQLEISRRLKYGHENVRVKAENLLVEIKKMLNSMIKKLEV